jgi:hypothetical protein
LRENYEGLCVETLDEAFALCRQKAREHEQRLKEGVITVALGRHREKSLPGNQLTVGV